MARGSSTPDNEEAGVTLYDKEGRAITVRSAVERTQLRAWGYTDTKPKDPEPEVPVPDGGPLA